MHIACRSGVEQMVEILCDNGADPTSIINNAGKSPVDLSRTHKTYQILHLTSEKQRNLAEIENLRTDLESMMTGNVKHCDDVTQDIHYASFQNEKNPRVRMENINSAPTNAKYSELKPYDIWRSRPNYSETLSMKEKLLKIEKQAASGVMVSSQSTSTS